MLPILLEIGRFKLYTVGVFLLLAFFWGLFWFWRNSKKTSYKEEQLFDIVFLSLITAFIFSRALYVALHFNDFGFSLYKILLINGYPGLTLIGGIFGGYIGLALFTRLTKYSFFEIAAYTTPSVFLAMAIGKIGALFGGNVAGIVTDFPIAITYAGLEGSRHIVAIYESILFVMGFILSQQMLMRYRRDAVKVSSIFGFLLGMTAFTELVLDFLKDDPLYLGSIRFSVVVSSVVLGVVLILEGVKYRNEIAATVKKLFSRKNDKKK